MSDKEENFKFHSSSTKNQQLYILWVPAGHAACFGLLREVLDC